MIALSVSLFFLGCSQDSEEETITTKTAAETLAEADDLAGKVDVDGTVVTLNADVTVAGTVTVPADVTLKVPADKTLTVTGTLTGASGTAKVVVATGGTVTGGSFYPATVTAGTYVWATNADGDGNAGWKQTIADLSADYSLKETCVDADGQDEDTGSGIIIDSVLQNVATNEITITLSGTFGGKYVYVADGNAYNASNKGTRFEVNAWLVSTAFSPAAGVYGAVNFLGLVPTDGFTDVAIKNTNPALGFYTPASGNPLTVLAAPSDTNNICFPADGSVPFKWKISTLASTDVLGLLLYSVGSASSKIVTLDIDQYADSVFESDLLTVKIDYSAVVFPAEADTTPDPEPTES
jgi:hypothetical protein